MEPERRKNRSRKFDGGWEDLVGQTYMLDDWIRLWDFDVVWNVHFLDMWNMDLLNMGDWVGDFLDDGQSLFFMVMVVMRFFVVYMFLVTEILAAVAVAAKVMTAEVMASIFMFSK